MYPYLICLVLQHVEGILCLQGLLGLPGETGESGVRVCFLSSICIYDYVYVIHLIYTYVKVDSVVATGIISIRFVIHIFIQGRKATNWVLGCNAIGCNGYGRV